MAMESVRGRERVVTEAHVEFSLVAKTLTGLEEVLAEELRALGAKEVRPLSRLVTFRGNRRLLYKTNLRLRTAIRVLQRIKKFNVVDEQHLYDAIREIDWSQYLDPAGTLAIDPVVTNSTFTHSLYVAQKAKDAICDQFRERTGVRPSVDLDDPDLRLNLHMNQNIVSLYLDSSGDSLHKRGYRTVMTEAPINEALAAGILMLSEWDRRSPLLDPMCGSGTFPIEAALLARNIAPGVFRKRFGFERWKDFDRALYLDVCQEAERDERPALDFPILGSDQDANAARIAQQNVKNAGLADQVRIECKPFEEQTPPRPAGVVVMNPPYGERLEVARINTLYRLIGDTLKAKYAGWTAYVFSGNLGALTSVGLRPSRQFTLYNGPIESRLIEYHLHGGTPKPPATRPEPAPERRPAGRRRRTGFHPKGKS